MFNGIRAKTENDYIVHDILPQYLSRVYRQTGCSNGLCRAPVQVRV
jgi:hypothetical protein